MTQVSVIIPAYNASATLDRTLASVRAQSHQKLEIIVVDDGSKDDTVDLVMRHAEEDSRIQLVSQPNGGVASARNHGIEVATSNWVAPLDADDVWHPDTVKNFLAAAEEAPEPVVFVYTWSRRIDEEDYLLTDLGRPKYAGNVLTQLIAANFTRNASATMLSRADVLRVGGYDTGLQAAGSHGAEDIDMYLKLAAIGDAAVAEGFHVGYRQMPKSMSHSADRMRNSIELTLNKLQHEQPELDSGLFSLARTNGDLYAAGLSLASGSWSGLVRHAFTALKRNTVLAAAYLAVFGLDRLKLLIKKQKGKKFESLDPQETYTWAAPDLIMSVQDKVYKNLFNTPLVGRA